MGCVQDFHPEVRREVICPNSKLMSKSKFVLESMPELIPAFEPISKSDSKSESESKCEPMSVSEPIAEPIAKPMSEPKSKPVPVPHAIGFCHASILPCGIKGQHASEAEHGCPTCTFQSVCHNPNYYPKEDFTSGGARMA